jgi:hypothetical protein
MRYTVVIPAYNEVESVGKLVEILGPVLAGMSAAAALAASMAGMSRRFMVGASARSG